VKCKRVRGMVAIDPSVAVRQATPDESKAGQARSTRLSTRVWHRRLDGVASVLVIVSVTSFLLFPLPAAGERGCCFTPNGCETLTQQQCDATGSGATFEANRHCSNIVTCVDGKTRPALPGWAGIALVFSVVAAGTFVFGHRSREPAT